MAKGRIVNTVISMSERVSELPIEAQLLYTWMIPHADDFGFLQGSAKTIKAQVMPMNDIPVTTIDSHLTTMCNQGLITLVEYDGKQFYHIAQFAENQPLRRDRQPQTILPIKLAEKPQDSWMLLDSLKLTTIDSHLTTNASHAQPNPHSVRAELNRNELKRKEKKRKEGKCEGKENIVPPVGGTVKAKALNGYEQAKAVRASL